MSENSQSNNLICKSPTADSVWQLMPSRVGLGTLKSLFTNLVEDRGAVEIQSCNFPA